MQISAYTDTHAQNMLSMYGSRILGEQSMDGSPKQKTGSTVSGDRISISAEAMAMLARSMQGSRAEEALPKSEGAGQDRQDGSSESFEDRQAAAEAEAAVQAAVTAAEESPDPSLSGDASADSEKQNAAADQTNTNTESVQNQIQALVGQLAALTFQAGSSLDPAIQGQIAELQIRISSLQAQAGM